MQDVYIVRLIIKKVNIPAINGGVFTYVFHKSLIRITQFSCHNALLF